MVVFGKKKNAAIQGNKQAPLTKHETPGHTQPEANAAHVTGATKTKKKKVLALEVFKLNSNRLTSL